MLLFTREWPACGFSWNFISEARRPFQTLSVASQVVSVMMLVTHTIGLASASPFYRLPWRLSSEESTWQCRRHGFDAWVGKIPGRGNGSPLCSRLENPMDRGAWWATVRGVPKSQTRVSEQIREQSHFTDGDDEISGTGRLTQVQSPDSRAVCGRRTGRQPLCGGGPSPS